MEPDHAYKYHRQCYKFSEESAKCVFVANFGR